LDREEEALHILVIKASERCQETPETIDFFDPSDDTLLKVVVNVNDINDNPPVFTKGGCQFRIQSLSIHREID